MTLTFVEERIAQPTDWTFCEDHHTFVVHRAGTMDSMETVFEHGPAGRVLPLVSDVWIIPAGCRYAALAKGVDVAFCELTIPTRLLGNREILPRMGHQDPFLHHMVDRIAAVAARTDDLADALHASAAEMLRLHLLDAYAGERAGRRSRPRVFTSSERARLTEHIRATLETKHSVTDLARVAELPVADFLASFAASFGTTPHRFLTVQRIGAAKQQLAAGRKSITEIALDLGFASPGHFATSFRQHVGITPTTFRQLNRGR